MRIKLLIGVLLVMVALLGGCEYWRIISLKEVFPPTRTIPTPQPIRIELDDLRERC